MTSQQEEMPKKWHHRHARKIKFGAALAVLTVLVYSSTAFVFNLGTSSSTQSANLKKQNQAITSIIAANIQTSDLEGAINVEDNKLVGPDEFKARITSTETYFEFKDDEKKSYWVKGEVKKATTDTAKGIVKGVSTERSALAEISSVIDSATPSEQAETTSNPEKKMAKETDREKITYDDVVPGVDIEQKVYNGKIKEALIVEDKDAPTTFEYQLSSSENLDLKQQGDKIVFTKKGEETALVDIERAFALDKNGKEYAFRYILDGNKLILEPDSDLSGVVYPLNIDPSYTVVTGLSSSPASLDYNNGRRSARDSAGNLYVVYHRHDGTQQNVFIAKSTNAGQTWAETQLTTEYDNPQRDPSIAIDGNNYLHVVWEGWTYNSSINYQIFYKKFTTSWQATTLLSEDANYAQQMASVAVDGNNNVHVVWSGKSAASTTVYRIRYTVFTSSWSAVTNLVNDGAGYKPSIAVDYQGHIHIVWYGGFASALGPNQIRHIEYTSSWGTIDNLTNEAYWQTDPQIAISDNGNVYVAFQGKQANDAYRLRFIKYASSWQPIENLSSEADYNQWGANVSTDASNNIHVAWYGECSACGGYPQIWYKQYTSSWGTTTNLYNTINTATLSRANFLWSSYPIIAGSKTNRPSVGYTMVYNQSGTAKYSASADLSWVDPPTSTVPDAPTAVSATAGNAQATVSFTPPANNGGAAITGYTVTSTPGGLTGTGASSPITVTGLTNGTGYTFTVHATNSVGNSAESSASASVTPAVPGINLSGTVYLDQESGTTLADNKTIGLSINGGAKITTETTAGGNYTFSTVAGLNTGDIATFFIDGEAEKANFVTILSDVSTNVSGILITVGKVKISHLSAGPVTNVTLNTADNCADDDLRFSVSGGNLTVDPSVTLWIRVEKTFTPGGNVTAGDILINGTLSLGVYSLNVSGSLTNLGTLSTNGSVTFNSTSTGKTVTTNGSNLGNLIFNNAGGEWTLQDNLIANSLTVTAGKLIDNAKTVSIAGNITIANSADHLASTGSWVLTASGTVDNEFVNITSNNAFNSFTINSNITATVNTWLDTAKLILSSGSTLSGTGSTRITYPDENNPISVNATATFSNTLVISLDENSSIEQSALNLPLIDAMITPAWKVGSGTLKMTGNFSFKSLVVYSGETCFLESCAETLDTNGSNLSVTGNLTLGTSVSTGRYAKVLFKTGTHTIGGNLSVGSFNGEYSKGYIDIATSNVSIGGNLDLTGSEFTPGTGTIHFVSTASGKTLTSAGKTLPNLEFDGTGGEWTLQDNLTSSSVHLVAGKLIDNAKSVTVNGDIIIEDVANGLLSTGNWSIGANGSLKNFASNPGFTSTIFNSMTIKTGVSATVITVLNTQKLIMEDSSSISGGNVHFYPDESNCFVQGANTSVAVTDVKIHWGVQNSINEQGSINIPNTPLKILYGRGTIYKMTGSWNVADLFIEGGWLETSEDVATTLDTNGYNLTVNGNLLFGETRSNTADGFYAKIFFRSGTHQISGDLRANITQATNTHGYLDLGTSNISIGGNVNLLKSTVTPGTSTVTLNGSAQQALGNVGSNTLNNLTVANSSVSGVLFQDSLTLSGTLTAIVPSSKVTFNSAANYNFNGINVNGGSKNTRVNFVASTPGSQYSLNVSAANPVVSYLNVSDSNASGGNAISAVTGSWDSGNNLNYTFSAPDAPTIGAVTGSDEQASVAFTPPVEVGSSNITGYIVTSSPGGITGTGASSPIIITGLTNGTSYTFTVHAINSAGSGSESTASGSIIPAAVADAPTSIVAERGNAQASISFSAPIDNGGSAITGYTVTSSPGGFTGTGSSSPINVSGLTNGVSYTFTVHATNGVGDGPESSASNSVTPATVPGVPTIGAVTAGNGQVSVGFSPPTDNGGFDITSYTVTSNPGNISATAASGSVVIPNLTNGVAYTFTVHATTSIGNSGESSSSEASVPQSVPSAPTISTVSSSSSRAVINQNSNPASTRYSIALSSNGSDWVYAKHEDGTTQAAEDWQLYSDWGSGAGFLIRGLTANTTYAYKIKAKYPSGFETDYSPTASLKTSNPEIGFASSAASGSISISEVTIPINLDVLSSEDAEVNVAATGGTAASEDFNFSDVTAVIPVGSTSMTVPLTIINNHLIGSDRTIEFTLSSAAHASLSSVNTLIYTIINDNVGPSGSFAINSGQSKTNTAEISLAILNNLATHYRVSRLSNFSDTEYESIESTASYTLPDEDKLYTLYLQLKDQYGNESEVYSDSIILDRQDPAGVTSPNIQSGNRSISLSWSNPSDSDLQKLVVYRSKSPSFDIANAEKTFEVSAPAATYTDRDVLNDQNYFYKVAAIDDIGNSSILSDEVTGRADSDSPTTPGKPTISETTTEFEDKAFINSRKVTFNWATSKDTNSGIKGYYLTVGTRSGADDVLNLKEVSDTELAYEFSSDGTYYARVLAKDNRDNPSAYSEEFVLTVDTTAPQDLAQAQIYDVSDRSGGIYGAAVAFKTPSDTTSGIKGYVIYRNENAITDKDNSLTNVVSDNKTGYSFYFDKLSRKAKASYTIKAIDRCGNETEQIRAVLADTQLTKTTGQKVGSNEVELFDTIIGEGKLDISDISASASGVVGEKAQTKITWKTTVPSTSMISFGTSLSYDRKTDLDNGLNTSHTMVLSDLNPGTTYHFKVTSKDKSGTEISSSDQSFTTGSKTKEKNVLDLITETISNSFARIWRSLTGLFGALASAADPSVDIATMAVVDITTPSQPGYAVYWPEGKGKVAIQRSEGGSFVSVGETEQNFFFDFSVKSEGAYTYRVGDLTGTVKDELSGKSIISEVDIKAGESSKDEASVVVSFKTDRLAKSQIFYGEGSSLDNQTELDQSLNQSHVVLIEKLKPNKTYSFRLKAQDKTDQEITESTTQSFTTPKSPIEKTTFELIVDALQEAFAGFGRFMK